MSYDKYAPQPNTNIEIATEEPGFSSAYLTRVDDSGRDGILVICPYENGEVVPFHEGMKVSATYMDHRAVYSFDSEVVERIGGKIPKLMLSVPIEIVRVQRREHLRMAARFPVKYAVITSDHDLRSKIDMFDAESVDICGGGIRIKLTEVLEDIKIGTYIRCKFKMPGEIEFLDLRCQVVRIENYSESFGLRAKFHEVDESEGIWRIALRFVAISNRAQDMITRFVFAKERELIRKGVVDRI